MWGLFVNNKRERKYTDNAFAITSEKQLLNRWKNIHKQFNHYPPDLHQVIKNSFEMAIQDFKRWKKDNGKQIKIGEIYFND